MRTEKKVYIENIEHIRQSVAFGKALGSGLIKDKSQWSGIPISELLQDGDEIIKTMVEIKEKLMNELDGELKKTVIKIEKLVI